ncbi:unnamed protein product [Echinostoma caproni]|uniref:Integrase catalytic domain-containing protein n=1 Tax=Echinostoma caproni TaxID=27848 RepID=A0A183BEU5_9TREM|nr:unnamed protein product [Echinostoma caproni]
MLGDKHARITTYHPAAKGLVERFHRQLKAAIKAHPGSEWHEALPLVLLGVRNTIKADLHTKPATLALGCTLRLPDSIRIPLQTPYTGPHKIIMRNDKYAMIEVNDKKEFISLDRLKPAFLETDTISITPTEAADPSSVDPTLIRPTENHPSTPTLILVKHDRRGREVRKPVRFQF